MSGEKEIIASLVSFFTEEESLKEQIAAEKDIAKELGFDPAILAAVAKAIVKNKVDDLIEKSESLIAAAELSRS